MAEERDRLSESERRVPPHHARARAPASASNSSGRALWRRWAFIVLGGFFLALGVLGLFLPILQGFLFLAVGAMLLARELGWVRRRRDRLYARYPRLGAWNGKAEAWVERQGRRIVAFFRCRA